MVVRTVPLALAYDLGQDGGRKHGKNILESISSAFVKHGFAQDRITTEDSILLGLI